MKLLRRLLILTHRYLGIALSLVIVMWFATGIVMMYAGGMPRLTPESRLERLPDLDLSRVRLTAADAASRAGVEDAPGWTLLLSVLDRPAYRFASGGPATVFADTGEVMEELTLAQSRRVASRFLDVPEPQIHFERTITDVDQWTLTQGRLLPLHKFRVDDAAATEVYVSPLTGEVGMLTTRRGRALAWAGTIPHWFYFAALRANQQAWYRSVVWTAALACVLALLGLMLAFTQFRRRRPFTLSAAIPYAGWMRWHYVTGALFGVFTLTWAFSGMLSMEPFAWTNAEGLEVRRDVFTGGPIDLAQFPAFDAAAWTRVTGGRGIKEIELARIQDEPYYVVRHAANDLASPFRRERLHQPYPVGGRRDADRLLVAAATLDVRGAPFSVDSLVGRLRAGVPEAPIVEQALLSDYDSYYYSRARQTPLPILRVKFADPAATWVYVDPEMSEVVASIHRLNRVERWLYNGLHSLDFAFWYNSIAWDIGMIALSLGGLASSGIGLLLGVRRLRRGVAGAAAQVLGERNAGEERGGEAGDGHEAARHAVIHRAR